MATVRCLCSEASLSDISSCLAAALGVTQFITINVMDWVTLCCPDLDVQETHLCGLFVEQKIILSYSFERDTIHNNQFYELGHTVVLL